jgi:hypothetical protein
MSPKTHRNRRLIATRKRTAVEFCATIITLLASRLGMFPGNKVALRSVGVCSDLDGVHHPSRERISLRIIGLWRVNFWFWDGTQKGRGIAWFGGWFAWVDFGPWSMYVIFQFLPFLSGSAAKGMDCHEANIEPNFTFHLVGGLSRMDHMLRASDLERKWSLRLKYLPRTAEWKKRDVFVHPTIRNQIAITILFNRVPSVTHDLVSRKRLEGHRHLDNWRVET